MATQMPTRSGHHFGKGRQSRHQGQTSSEHKASHHLQHTHLVLTWLHLLRWCQLLSSVLSHALRGRSAVIFQRDGGALRDGPSPCLYLLLASQTRAATWCFQRSHLQHNQNVPRTPPCHPEQIVSPGSPMSLTEEVGRDSTHSGMQHAAHSPVAREGYPNPPGPQGETWHHDGCFHVS